MTLPVIRRVLQEGHQVGLLVKGPVEKQVAVTLLKGRLDPIVVRQAAGASRLRNFLRIAGEIRAMRPDWILAQANLNPAQFSLLALAAGGKRRIGWKGRLSWLNTTSLVPGGGHKVEETARYLDLMGMTWRAEDLVLGNLLPQGARKDRLAILAPGSGAVEAHKRWPAEKFCRLAALLALDHGYEVRVVGGPEEAPLCAGIADGAGSSSVRSVAGELGIGQVLELLAESTVAVTNCNGVSHLAVATGTPVVGIYGPTNAHKTGPYTQLFRRVSLDLDCAPCYQKGYIQGCGNPVCMMDIPVEDVLAAVLDLASPSGEGTTQ